MAFDPRIVKIYFFASVVQDLATQGSFACTYTIQGKGMDKSRVPSNNIPSSIPQLKTLNTRNLSLIINEIRYYPNLINEQIQKKAKMNDKGAKVVCK